MNSQFNNGLYGFSPMQPANPITSTQARPVAPAATLAQAENAAVSQVVAESSAAVKFEVGQQLQATIQEQVNPGLYKVQIAGQSMQMQLPGLIKVGSQIILQVISTIPRLIFSLPSSSTPLSTAEEISSTSLLLSNLTQQPLSKTIVESASGRAVWPSKETVPESSPLAAALKDALANSGLFYESHQAQWVAGTRTTAQLLTEPQNQLVQVAMNAQPIPSGKEPAQVKGKPGSAESIKPDAHAAALPQSATTGNTTEEMLTKRVTTGTPSNASSNTSLPIAKELIPLVQQQLHTLETHQITWSGQVWPNQQLQWEIQGESGNHSSRPDERQWRTEIELSLPRLGNVHANLVFNQDAIRLTLHAADDNASALFDRRLPELATAMKSAGISLSSAVVTKS